MTEYLTQLSLGCPDIEQLSNGGLYIRPGVPYRAPVFAMLALHEQFKLGKNYHFASLFNTYHGDRVNSVQLEKALEAFYQYNIKIQRSEQGVR